MQSSRPSQGPTRRRHERAAARVTVRWHNRSEEGVLAVLHDVSAEGLFLVPEGALPDGVSVGDSVWVVVPSGDHSETLSGTVRWRGFHPRHGLIGVGIQVEGRSLALIQRAFPFLLGAQPDI